MEATAPPTTLTEAELRAAGGRGVDAEFTRLAREIPGFGGMYFDRAGRLTVHMKAPAGANATIQRGADVLGRLRARGSAAVQRRLASSTEVVTKAATYDYVELQAYRARLKGLSKVRGLVYVDTDEERNRIRIGIQPNAAERDVVRVLARAGVPREAVIISRSPAAQRVKHIQSRFRPVPGGIQLAFPPPNPNAPFFFICTHTFNVRLANRPNRNFFLTASHCSGAAPSNGGNQHTRYFQPLPGPNNRIGTEFRDPRYGDLDGNCIFYPGTGCRFSDALLAEYVDGVNPAFGKLARTTFARRRIGSFVIDPNHPRWNVVGEVPFPFLGEEINKQGRTTGWTKGPVVGSCRDFVFVDDAVTLICQDIAETFVLGGDSGSPIFIRVGPNEILLAGVLWGGFPGEPLIIFSAMENIEQDLGELHTSTADLVAAR
jgi:hypothetical protein